MSTKNKLTMKMAAFAAAYIEHGRGSAAYRAAYAAENMTAGSVRVEACRLLQHPNVAQHIDEARKRMATKLDITQQRIVEMLLEDRQFAQTLRNASAATAASMGIAKVTGHLTEDRRNTRTPLQDFGTEELLVLEKMLAQSLRDHPEVDEATPVDGAIRH